MAKRIRAKLVLGLLARGMSGREIRSTRHISHRSIKLVRDAADRAGVTWEDARILRWAREIGPNARAVVDRKCRARHLTASYTTP